MHGVAEEGSNAMPLFAVPFCHAFTAVVMSTTMYLLAVETGTAVASGVALSDGLLVKTVAASVQGLVTWQTSRLPESDTVFTYNFTVAFETWLPVVPAGIPERSNFTRAALIG